MSARCAARHPAEPVTCRLAPRGHHDAHEAWWGMVLLVWLGDWARAAA